MILASSAVPVCLIGNRPIIAAVGADHTAGSTDLLIGLISGEDHIQHRVISAVYLYTWLFSLKK